MSSAKIQNEIAACIAKFARMKIKDIVEETNYFSIIADEVTDRLNQQRNLVVVSKVFKHRS